MDLHIESTLQEDNIYVIKLSGKMNALTVGELKNLLKKIIPETAIRIIIDLDKISFIDSSGLSTLISVLKKTREEGGYLRLIHIQPQVMHIFELTMLDRVFEMYQSFEDAIKA